MSLVRLVSLIVLFLLLGCLPQLSNITEVIIPAPASGVTRPALAQNTILIYINADNNLDGFAVSDLHEIEKGFSTNFASNSLSNNVLVYVDRANGASPSYAYMLEVGYDADPNKIDSRVVRVFGEKDSSAASSLEQVLGYSLENYPAENYGLILWSHGTGWLSSGYAETSTRSYKGGYDKRSHYYKAGHYKRSQDKAGYTTKTFGLDYDSGFSEMPLLDLARAISNALGHNRVDKLDYIIFDACYMGDVEVAFQLRNYSDYILSSQTEIMVEGLPYDKVIPHLLEVEKNNRDGAQESGVETKLKAVIDDFEAFYSNQSIPFKRTAQMSLLKSSHLENLSASFKNFLEENRSIVTNDFALSYVENPTLVDGYLDVKYDLKDFVQEMSGNPTINAISNASNVSVNKFIDSFDGVVIYHKKSDKILASKSTENLFGLNVYIPESSKTNLNEYYKSLDWYEKSGLSFYFN